MFNILKKTVCIFSYTDLVLLLLVVHASIEDSWSRNDIKKLVGSRIEHSQMSPNDTNKIHVLTNEVCSCFLVIKTKRYVIFKRLYEVKVN